MTSINEVSSIPKTKKPSGKFYYESLFLLLGYSYFI